MGVRCQHHSRTPCHALGISQNRESSDGCVSQGQLPQRQILLRPSRPPASWTSCHPAFVPSHISSAASSTFRFTNVTPLPISASNHTRLSSAYRCERRDDGWLACSVTFKWLENTRCVRPWGSSARWVDQPNWTERCAHVTFVASWALLANIVKDSFCEINLSVVLISATVYQMPGLAIFHALGPSPSTIRGEVARASDQKTAKCRAIAVPVRLATVNSAP